MQNGKIDYSIDSHYHSDYLNDVVKIRFFRLFKRSFNGTHNIHSLYTALLRHYLDLLRQDITTNNIHK